MWLVTKDTTGTAFGNPLWRLRTLRRADRLPSNASAVQSIIATSDALVKAASISVCPGYAIPARCTAALQIGAVVIASSSPPIARDVAVSIALTAAAPARASTVPIEISCGDIRTTFKTSIVPCAATACAGVLIILSFSCGIPGGVNLTVASRRISGLPTTIG